MARWRSECRPMWRVRGLPMAARWIPRAWMRHAPPRSTVAAARSATHRRSCASSARSSPRFAISASRSPWIRRTARRASAGRSLKISRWPIARRSRNAGPRPGLRGANSAPSTFSRARAAAAATAPRSSVARTWRHACRISVVARAALAARELAHGAAIIGAAYAGAADAAQGGHALLITGVIAGLGAALVAIDGAPGIVIGGLGGARLRLGQDRKPDQGRQRYCAHGGLP